MRGKQSPKRDIDPDPKYNSTIIAKFINAIMERGKKTVAQKIVYDCFHIIQKKTNQNPLDMFDLAVRNVTPMVEVRSRRIGGSNYQVPVEVKGTRRTALTFRWIIGAAASRKGKPMREKLAEEIIAASKNEGDAVKKKQDVQRMAEANRAFAHFA
ncbi:MAG: 30S ribosomal protein S7 [Candidatus Kerfeldbacteria bacterium RIFCSPHIGHO2_02_FULL_42_14]|uniref:Small ribosomal subunit protein uS7 n=1 Tax=Candidatus Kerfeldbacteria bacterium RIFCSPHIGHO2_02_FULL_42_14 TaxID=1798540 RepID=A0A1G2ARV0_9BACT|nr:MAG: 30S ribosomal protein S7 [Candidatus Kerfeldbacteria bacterium RIFCSPHIGHO2_02_FULL_42_14]OGY80433.1 MAG: 30S ribosomal protein S7 [Candidatus Kerfeldbacteria bacterium RIFCSPHIGHO2_12_FULL_42_13]OGY83863.1 MAG: 30S ribosomal protein S7 [Candidatus Kerfeldbacteria bacterium RIFCSPLOWO2_02_FULL_42_19]OGY86598.1 MAG: 30S ribosomal protein S7 [Candidatus Kerfeldbacteria bacterium RIFCSPLOWO2_12_FULL_43_9]